MAGRRSRSPRRAELSQHFLRSRALASSLVEQCGVSERDLVVEIGAGTGMLTAELARRCHTVLAVELDPTLSDRLRVRFADEPRVSVIRGDFLGFELPRDRPYRIVGNIPYGVTAAIVRRVTQARPAAEDVHLVVQREAALRFAGSPFGPETLSSLLLKPDWQVEIVRELRREDFEPASRVSSSVLWLAHRARPLVRPSELAAYRSFVSASFGRAGRSVDRCLRPLLSRRQVRRLARTLRFDPDAAPSALSFDQWLAVFRFYSWNRALGRSSGR